MPTKREFEISCPIISDEIPITHDDSINAYLELAHKAIHEGKPWLAEIYVFCFYMPHCSKPMDEPLLSFWEELLLAHGYNGYKMRIAETDHVYQQNITEEETFSYAMDPADATDLQRYFIESNVRKTRMNKGHTIFRGDLASWYYYIYELLASDLFTIKPPFLKWEQIINTPYDLSLVHARIFVKKISPDSSGPINYDSYKLMRTLSY